MTFDFVSLQNMFLNFAPGLPESAWWVPPAVLLFLLSTAAIDAFTSTVPDGLIFTGLVLVTGAQGFYVSWDFAAAHLAFALASTIAIWAVNQLWYRVMKHDALGMGDAKWTMLAVSAFGLIPALIAWGVGAVMAVVFLMTLQIARHKSAHVHFAPFLFLGLCLGLFIRPAVVTGFFR